MIARLTAKINRMTSRLQAVVMFLEYAKRINPDNPAAVAYGLPFLFSAAECAVQVANGQDKSMGGVKADGSDSRPPEGDDWNELHGYVMALDTGIKLMREPANSPMGEGGAP